MTFGIGAHLLGRAVGDLDAVVEHDDVVGNLHHHRHVVFDEQDRGVVLVADRDAAARFSSSEPNGFCSDNSPGNSHQTFKRGRHVNLVSL